MSRVSLTRTNQLPVAQAIGGDPAVYVANTPHGIWTGNPNFGREAKFAPSSNNRQSILTLPEYGAPVVWTVSLYLVNTVQNYNGFGVTAEIQFGVGGSTQNYKCDWINGQQISLPANAINVVASYQDVDVVTEGAGLRLGVQIGQGARTNTAAPVLTIAQDYIIDGGGGSIYTDIPQFAKRAFLISTVNPGNLTYGTFYDDNTVLAMQAGDAVGPKFTAFLPFGNANVAALGLAVTGQSRKVLVQNNGAKPIRGTLYFELDG